MKKHILLLFPAFLMSSCNGVSQSKTTIIRYCDDDYVAVNNINFRLDVRGYTEIKDISFSLYTTSNNIDPTTIELKNGIIYRESNGARYNVFSKEQIYLENEIENHNSFDVSLPTTLSEEKYQFIFEVFGKTIKYNLYFNPENYFNVYYKINGEIISSEVVHKGGFATHGFTYENPNHLEFARSWVDEEGTYTTRNPIFKDTYFIPVMEPAISYLTTSSDLYAYVKDIKHVFRDGVCVLDETYENKPIGIGSRWNYYGYITDLYLPRTLACVSNFAFEDTTNLKIHYPESQETWNQKINYTGGFGSGTTIIFNSSFSY